MFYALLISNVSFVFAHMNRGRANLKEKILGRYFNVTAEVPPAKTEAAQASGEPELQLDDMADLKIEAAAKKAGCCCALL